MHKLVLVRKEFIVFFFILLKMLIEKLTKTIRSDKFTLLLGYLFACRVYIFPKKSVD